MDKKKKFGRKKYYVILWLCLCIFFPPFHVSAESSIYHISNLLDQNYSYSRYARPVQSYFVAVNDNTYMRFQSAVNDEILVEYYDSDYRLKSCRTIATELPIFGAFYQYGEYYYIVSGQENPQCSDSVEVFRITKYDKNWNRISAASLYGANTARPFDAGSCRLAGDGKYLLIRTCHLMYGRHQANVTIQVDTESMQITDSYTDIMNKKYGYVSHSFNQFIAVENHRIVALDHGDAYPRSVVLTKYPTDVSGGSFRSSNCSTTDVIPISGEIGDNNTGVMVNAFDVGTGNYVIAGTALEQNGKNGNTYNVYVATVDKNTMAVKQKWITNYSAGVNGCSNPQLVKLFENRYVLLWNRWEQNALKLYYAIIDENGEIQGEVYSDLAGLSDCVPIVHQNKLIWYVDNGHDLIINEINLANMQHTFKIALEEGAVKPNYLTFTAEEGGSSVRFTYLSGTNVQYSRDGGVSWSNYGLGQELILSEAGDKVCFKGRNVEMEFGGVYSHFDMTGKIAASGSVTSLTDENGGDVNVSLSEDCYAYMFYGCTSLTSAPELPATTLASGCYYDMFTDCTSLTRAPELPATTLASGCYSHMFRGCTSLTRAPELPATTLASGCYSHMFRGCTSLTSAPKLPATTLAEGCYYMMFLGCTKLEISLNKEEGVEWSIPASSYELSWNQEMFNDCPNVDFDGKGSKEPELGVTYYQKKSESTQQEQKPDIDYGLTADGVYLMSNDVNGFVAGMVHSVQVQTELEFRWTAYRTEDQTSVVIQDWNTKDCWLNWKPEQYGEYILTAEARIKEAPDVVVSTQSEAVRYTPYIKGKCQMPYTGEGGGYLIGIETYDNPNQSYTYEMLILDCTLLAEGKDAWIYTTGRCGVAEGNALWTVWQPQYGYYWTLFRVYDANGVMIDQDCYGFVNAY